MRFPTFFTQGVGSAKRHGGAGERENIVVGMNDDTKNARGPYAGANPVMTKDIANAVIQLAAYKKALDAHALVSKTDARGRITAANDTFCEISGYARDELIGKDHRMLNSGHHSNEFMADLWKTIRDQQIWHGTIRNLSKDGSFYWVKSTIFPVVNKNNDICEFISIRTHVPDLQVAKDEAEAASHLKSEFLAVMSHEIRTPMNGVLGAAEILQTMDLSSEMRRFVDIISDSGTSLLELLNDILDLSKLNAGKTVFEETEFRLSDTVGKVASIHNLKASEKDIGLNVTIDNDVNDFRVGDPGKLTQILHNLLSNAVKFTNDGLVQLTLSNASKDTGDEAALMIAVSDTGIGMSDEQIANVFSPFVQADSSIARNFGGTGLGLSIVKRIVDAMGGEINLSSTPGVGSTFRIKLNFATATKTSAVAPQKNAVNVGKLPAATSILVAEDNETNRLIIKTFLKRAGATATMAENGKEAVEHFQRGQYDLILMDIHMPVMDGEEAFQEIRNLQDKGGLNHTPIIAVTADAMDHQVRHYLDFGFDGHLPKPVTEKSLVQTILQNLPSVKTDSLSSSAASTAHS